MRCKMQNKRAMKFFHLHLRNNILILRNTRQPERNYDLKRGVAIPG